MYNPTNILEKNSLQLLYVEDETKARELTHTILKQYFNKIVTAVDGEDGYNKFQNNKFDLIITDINMPKINGLDMIKKIRETNKDIPILIISAHNDTEYLLKSIEYRIHGYLLKPFQREQFNKVITKVINELTEKQNQKNKITLLKQYQKIIDKSSIVSKTDKNGLITYVNDAFCEISGYTREELIGRNHNIIRAKDEPKETFQELWKTIKIDKKTWEGVIKNRTKNNGLYYVKATIKPILNENGEVEEYIALRSLITDIIHPKKQLLDFLKLTDEYLIVLIKIEHFDYIQSSLSKDELEEVEKKFAQEIFKVQTNKKDFQKIYLLEKGEFVFAKKMEECKKSIPSIIKYLKEFKETINNGKIHIESINYNLSILISFAYGRDAFEDAEAGIKQLIETKQDFIIANGLRERQKQEALKHIKKFNLLRDAIDSYNIISYFQPIVNNKTKKIDKYESLVRLVDANDNILSPALFLDSAKKGKYYSQITSIVLRNSFQALYDTQMTISINLSALDIEQPKTREEFFELLKQHKSQAHRIIVELTEDENIKNINTIKKFINKIRKFGVEIAIDDFGSGLSNFSRVLQYQPNYIKIDGSLIKNINKDKLAKNMVETIVNFAQKANIKTVAEFVENKEIFEILCDLGVDYSQGYYFGKAELLKK
ncbi:MAG: EAL domain-containing protein [Epsilonproteobacteria bacterium]|nr:EAL domain-containing protein [Campylobacterota bacterium]